MNSASVSSRAQAEELRDLLTAFEAQFLPWIAKADRADSRVLDHQTPLDLQYLLDLSLPEESCGKDGLLAILNKTLRYSANTWHAGFMDKLFASTNPVGVLSELLLAVLNTNGHVYHVSPVLTIMEKQTSRAMAGLFGFRGENAGGLTLPGGSQSNTLSIVTARSILYPDTKENGNGSHNFCMFTSRHGHYSVEKAAIQLGLGRASVIAVDIDDQGRILPEALRAAVVNARADGKTPLYVNATAGTTVLGSFDPFTAISAICKEFGMWLHIDGSWGGSVAFSDTYKHLMEGSELADSITVNPHKMLGVPLQCSFLLAPDARIFQQANSLKAGYLFHGDDGGFDMGDSTMGCGRRPDAVKMFLGWNYYGRIGYERRIDTAYANAKYLAEQIAAHPNFSLVSSNPPPCLQICFYYHPALAGQGVKRNDAETNTRTTRAVAAMLDHDGRFMVDYAPGPHGEFFRAVMNSPNQNSSVLDELVSTISRLGEEAARLELQQSPVNGTASLRTIQTHSAISTGSPATKHSDSSSYDSNRGASLVMATPVIPQQNAGVYDPELAAGANTDMAHKAGSTNDDHSLALPRSPLGRQDTNGSSPSSSRVSSPIGEIAFQRKSWQSLHDAAKRLQLNQ
ncbi:Glutamate decarboxylase 2 [Savitreella phatthalungensis]